MKKLVSLAVGFLALFGLSASAFAIHAEIPAESQAVVAKGTVQLTISGDLRVRGWLKENVSSAGAITDKLNQTYYDERVRLAVDASQGNVSGRIHLESNGGNSDGYKWGTTPAFGSNSGPVGTDFNAKPTAVSILEAWLQYTGSGIGMPTGIKVGHMPLALGPDTLFFDNSKFGDDALVLWGDPTPQTHIVALTIKAAEGDTGSAGTSNAKDLDIYVGLINQVLAGQNLQAYYVYANGPDASTAIPVPGGSATFGPQIKLQDLGLNASGKFGGLTYTAEYDQNLGSAYVNGAKADTKGYALELDLGYKLGPAGVRLAGVYGSGPKAGSTKVDTFINFRGNDPYHTVVYGYQVQNAMGQVNGVGTFNQWSNTEMLNLGVDLNPAADLKLALDAFLLRASKTDAFGAGISHNIGSEYDAHIKYALAKNLTYFADAGALVAGNFYDDTHALFGGSKKTAIVVRHGLEFSF